MVKWYYTVIVGTQPGVYADWSQAAPTVIEISGAIHKKFKTYGEAREAFDRAGREGRVRAIQVDPQPDDFDAPAPISAAATLSVVPDYHRQRNFYQNARYPQNVPPACVAECSPRHPATRPVRRSSQRHGTANSTTNDITGQIRREPGNASRNTSTPVSAHDVDLVTSIGAGPLRRTMSEYHGNSRQPLRTMSGSGSPGSLSRPSRPVGRSRAYEHADLPSGEFRSWQGENRQDNEHGIAKPPGSPRISSTAAQHGDAAAAGASAEMEQRSRESSNSAPLRSLQTSRLTHRVPGESVEDISETAARTHRRPLDPFPSGARATIGSDHRSKFPFSSRPSPIPSTLGDQLVDHDEAEESRNRVLDFLSGLGRARNQGNDSDGRRASFRSVDTSLDSSDWVQRIHHSPTQFQTRTESDPSLGAPILSRPSSACSHISLASSTDTFKSTLSFDIDLTQAETSEESEIVASSTPPPVSPFFPSLRLEEDIGYSPSTLGVPSGEQQRHASSSQSGTHGSARGAQNPVEHMRSQFDHPNTGDDTLLPLPRRLSESPLPAVAPTLPTSTHFRTQNIRQSPTGTTASSPRGVWPTSPASHFSFELQVSPSTASGLGLLTGVASPRRHPLPQSPAAWTNPESPVDRSVRSTAARSPTRDTNSSRDAPQQDYESSPHVSAAIPEDTHSVRARPIDRGSLSHHNIPLPLSPAPSVADSFTTRLQVQPVHRHGPHMPLYPSLAGEDPELLSPSGLGIIFGLPTPGLSPMQAPAVIRSPTMDPRSPVPSQMRIPGDFMGTVFFGRPTPPTNDTRMSP